MKTPIQLSLKQKNMKVILFNIFANLFSYLAHEKIIEYLPSPWHSICYKWYRFQTLYTLHCTLGRDSEERQVVS
jgi:hypothetical protein